jgi:hypothetical protein
LKYFEIKGLILKPLFRYANTNIVSLKKYHGPPIPSDPASCLFHTSSSVSLPAKTLFCAYSYYTKRIFVVRQFVGEICKLFSNEVLVQLEFYKSDINLQYILLKFKEQWLHGTGNLSSHATSPLDGVLIELNLNWVVL